MIVDDKTRFHLARIIGQRMSDLEITSEKGEAEALAEYCSISPESSEAILWGELGTLTPEELESFSECLDFSYDILACLASPTSNEIIYHVLQTAQERYLDPACSVCLQLSDRIFESSGADMGLLLKVLEHLHLGDETKDRVRGEEELVEIFRALSPEGRARVLSVSYGELAGPEAPSRILEVVSWSRFRQEYLAESVRKILDLLAGEEDALSAGEIAKKTGHSARSVGQVPRAITRALEKLASEGYDLPVYPLVVHRRSSRSLYSLHPDARQVWLDMVQAEETSQG